VQKPVKVTDDVKKEKTKPAAQANKTKKKYRSFLTPR